MMGKELYKTAKDSAGDVLKMQLHAAVAASDEAKIMSAFISSLSHFKPIFFFILGAKK